MDQNAPMQIILVRHGETALNAARVLQPPDTPLSALGLQQAGAVARRLAGDGVAGIVSSDLARARQTAEAIAGAGQRGERLGNTAVTQVDATAPHTVRLFNCTRHLAAGLQEGAGSLSGG